jgi:hypothetical protein
LRAAEMARRTGMSIMLSLPGGTRRLQPEQSAAQIVGVELGTFRHLVACGHFPKPLPLIELYDMKAIDAALDRMSDLLSTTNVLDAWRGKRNAR